ncbi:DegV family protein [Anaerocolumna xylanovorans]|uniref:EDD domain protein, DegV family n=1 Tax=Anaerocolumna xylanovorans DSM 12503 TaxID=1121345 RepID=A0A1M7YLS9_9FIRM|nr:DegV family protein [Anaerocolumna xylanovorans]SHO53542.1 EDD domain protein, DegV family [Anaerocolumna xylanovorans DSM 12503]
MIKIIADSTCDLSKELLEKYDITIMPLCVIMGDNTYLDGVSINKDDIFTWAEKENSLPKTAAPTLESAVEVLKPFVKENSDILFFGISEDMSSSCNVVRLAGEYLEYKKIHIINSKNLSTGIGLQIIKAATMAQEGFSAGEIEDYIVSTMRDKVRASFVVDTLAYLHMGGRCSSVAALLGNVLQLKPMIAVRDGKMGVDKKYRGTNRKALTSYYSDLIPELKDADTERVFITHSGCDEETVEFLYKEIEQLGVFENIHITYAGAVISSHCGPKTLGILFVER